MRIFRYFCAIATAMLVMGSLVSCVDVNEDPIEQDVSNTPIGDFGEMKPLTVVTPDNQVLEDPFQVIEISHDDMHLDGLQIFGMTLGKDHPLREFTAWTLCVKVPDFQKLKKSQSLEIYNSELCGRASSSSGDFQSYILNGASVIVREANDEYIDLYIDHLKYTLTGFYLMNGDYYVFGDLRFQRSDIKELECFE